MHHATCSGSFQMARAFNVASIPGPDADTQDSSAAAVHRRGDHQPTPFLLHVLNDTFAICHAARRV